MAKRKPPPKTKKVDPAKAAAKKARRAERQRLEAESRKKRERRARLRRLGLGLLAAAGVAIVAFLVYGLVRPGAEIDGVEKPPNQGSRHLAPGETVSYGTATPTSGPHPVSSARCGVIPTGLSLELAVHSLEHGVVVVWFRPDLSEELLPDLTAIMNRWDSHVIVAPNPGIQEPIVATAWNRLMRFEEAGEPVAEFIDTYRRRGPESVPCDIEV